MGSACSSTLKRDPVVSTAILRAENQSCLAIQAVLPLHVSNQQHAGDHDHAFQPKFWADHCQFSARLHCLMGITRRISHRETVAQYFRQYGPASHSRWILLRNTGINRNEHDAKQHSLVPDRHTAPLHRQTSPKVERCSTTRKTCRLRSLSTRALPLLPVLCEFLGGFDRGIRGPPVCPWFRRIQWPYGNRPISINWRFLGHVAQQPSPLLHACHHFDEHLI